MITKLCYFLLFCIIQLFKGFNTFMRIGRCQVICINFCCFSIFMSKSILNILIGRLIMKNKHIMLPKKVKEMIKLLLFVAFGLLVNYGMYSLRTQFLSWEYDIFPFLRIVDTGLWYFTVVGVFIIFLVGTRDIIKAK